MKTNPLIFVVDDDKAFNRLMEAYLKRNNYRNIKCFFTGEDCIKNYHLNPDIVILDYNLNGNDPKNMNGLEVLGEINNIFQNPTVIMISGEMHQHAKKIIEAKFEKGMYRYIMKSNNTLDELGKAMKEITESDD